MKTFYISKRPAIISQVLFAILFTSKLVSCYELPLYGVPPSHTIRPSQLPGTGSLDVYNNFQWDVTKGSGEEDLGLSNTIAKQTVLDLALVMDCTGSMAAWIEHSKTTLNTVIDNIKDNSSNSESTGIFLIIY